jgi:nitrogen fixation/metabolism regulation signal transduction histidine kinase
MKIRLQYILFVAIIHLTLLFLSFLIFKENKLFFILSEVFILASVWLSIRLYRSLIYPIQSITAGVEAIKDQDFNIKLSKTGSYEMNKLVETYNKMMDKLKSEMVKQQEQHFFLDKLIQTSPIGILILDFDSHISSFNPRLKQLLNIQKDSLKGSEINALNHPIAPYLKDLKTGESKIVQLNGMATFKCQKAHFIDRGFKHFFITIEELTNVILHTEKKAYGKVIRMMAHEVNNSIGPINSILHSALNYENQLDTNIRADYRTAIEVAIERNNRLNVFMRNFADVVRLPPPYFETYDLNNLLTSIVNLYKAPAEKKGIQIHFQKTALPFLIKIDVAQFEQVLINIFKNAIESIEENGKIEVFLLEKQRKLIIRDNGAGIHPDFKQQLFTPFFSSKKEGQGIGLTLIREILNNHQFNFSLETIAPQKTEFSISF